MATKRKKPTRNRFPDAFVEILSQGFEYDVEELDDHIECWHWDEALEIARRIVAALEVMAKS